MVGCENWPVTVVFITNLHFAFTYFAHFSVENIALGKRTSQSSGNNYTSELAVNGDYGDYSLTTVAHFNWWAVDLDRVERVEMASAYTEHNFGGNYVGDISYKTSDYISPETPIRSNDKWTTRVTRVDSPLIFIMVCYPTIAVRHVAVTMEKLTYLKITEVEIIARSDSTNVARGKPAYQSEGFHPFYGLASEAVNGMVDDYAYPKKGANSFWKVDLQAKYTVELIRIFSDIRHFRRQPRITNIKVSSRLETDDAWSLIHEIVKDFKVKHIKTDSIQMRELHLSSAPHKTYLKLGEVEVYVETNLALHKPALQSSTVTGFGAEKAVNGYYGDFALTTVGSSNWWHVDLLEIYSVGSVQVIHQKDIPEARQRLVLYIAKANNYRTILNYDYGRYVETGKIDIPSSQETRYVNISLFNTNSPLNLTQVIIREYNFASDYLQANQSSTPRIRDVELGPERVVDGSLETFTMTNYYTGEAQWWIVHLVAKIIFTTSYVFFHQGQFPLTSDPRRALFESYLPTIQILTSVEENLPNIDDNNHWNSCLEKSSDIFFNPQAINCKWNIRHPMIKHFRVQTYRMNDRLVLSEVTIHGREPPLFSPSTVDTNIISNSDFSLQFSFTVWNILLVGAYAPTSYTVWLHNIEKSQTYKHRKKNQPAVATVRFGRLQPNTVYNYTITCQFRHWQCLGSNISGSTRTSNCNAPDEPTFQWRSEVLDKVGKLYVAIDNAKSNCRAIVSYRVILEENGVALHDQTGKSQIIPSLSLNTYYKLIVIVTNDANMKSSSFKVIVAGTESLGKPRLLSSEYNSSCVHLVIATPLKYRFKELYVKVLCTSGNVSHHNVVDGSNTNETSVVICNFYPESTIDCTVTLENSFRQSDALQVFGSTTADTQVKTTKVPRNKRPGRPSGIFTILSLVAGVVLVVLAMMCSSRLIIRAKRLGQRRLSKEAIESTK